MAVTGNVYVMCSDKVTDARQRASDHTFPVPLPNRLADFVFQPAAIG